MENLQKEIGIIDLHVDSIIQQRLFRYDLRKKHRAGIKGQPLFWHADIPRMLEAGYVGACLGMHYWPIETPKGWLELNRQLDYLDRLAKIDHRCLRVKQPGDWEKAKKEGKIALAAGVEGAHMLAGHLAHLETLVQRGISYLTLTHFSRNSAATPSIGIGANERDGLTPFGKNLVRLLNDYGVVVDVAHVNTPGVLEVCKISKAPVFCTHTGVKGVYDSARNISDTEIDAIARTNGAIGIIFGPIFLAGRFIVNTDKVLDHLEYVIERVGIKHLVIGSDYDGWLPTIPFDQRDCRDMAQLTSGLLQRGYSKEELELVFRKNALRVFEQAWQLKRK